MSRAEIDRILKAAKRATQEYDHSRAVKEYKRALSLMNADPHLHSNDKQRISINTKLVDALDQNGQWVEALNYVGLLLNKARLKGNRDLERQVNIRSGQLLTKRGHWEEAKKRFSRALDMAMEDGSHDDAAESHYGIAFISWRKGGIVNSRTEAKKALSLLDKKTECLLKGKTLILLAALEDNQGNTDNAIEKFIEAIKQLEPLDHGEELGRAYNNLGEVYKGMDDYSKALEQYERCVKVSHESHSPRSELYCLTNATECLALQGRVDEAEEHLNRVKELLDKIEEKYIQIMYHYIRGLIAGKRGNQALCSREFDITIEAVRRMGEEYDLGTIYLQYGKLLVSFGRKDEASTMYDRAGRCFKKVGARSYMGRVDQAIRAMNTRK